MKAIRLSMIFLSGFLIISETPAIFASKNDKIEKSMDQEKEQKELEQLYLDMYAYMITKDIESLGKILSEDFVLVHMTGMRQPKKDYLRAIKNGTLNYFSCDDSEIITDIQGEKAKLTGKSKVNAAVFGGGRHTWRLQLDIDLAKQNGKWLITEIRASTY